MALQKAIKPLGFTASILGIVQGTVFFSLALYCLLIYSEAVDVKTDNPKTYNDLLDIAIVNRFLKDKKDDGTYIVNDEGFLVIAIFHLILSLIILISSCILAAKTAKGQFKSTQVVFMEWASVMLLTSLYDFILMIIFGLDYGTSLSEFENLRTNMFVVLANGVVMVILARGYLLWVVNVAISGSMLYVAINAKENTSGSAAPYDAYRTNPWMATSDFNEGNANEGFYDSNHSLDHKFPPLERDFEQSTHFDDDPSSWNRNSNNPEYSNMPSPARTKVSPTLKKVPPPKVPDVHIPDPDYSPVLPRSLLKPTQNYI